VVSEATAEVGATKAHLVGKGVALGVEWVVQGMMAAARVAAEMAAARVVEETEAAETVAELAAGKAAAAMAAELEGG